MDNRRKALGQDNGNSKLTEERVRKIRRLAKEEKLTQRILADRFYISQMNVSKILSRKTWKWVK